MDSTGVQVREIIDELRRRVADAAVPAHAHVELGQFVEMLAQAFGDAVGENKQLHVSHWHTRLQDVHPATYSALATAFANRNIASHPNAAQEILTPESVAADLAGIERLLPIAIGHVRDSHDVDLLAALIAVMKRTRWGRYGESTTTTHQAVAPVATAATSSRMGWRVVGISLTIMLLAGGAWALLADPKLPTAEEVVSQWHVGDRWVYRSSIEVPAGHPDEHLAKVAVTQRELVKIVPTKVGVQLHFIATGGDDDAHERRVLWRVEANHIESMNPHTKKSRESAHRIAALSTAEELVFKTLKSTWNERIDPRVGPTLLSWTNKKRRFTVKRRLKYARVGGHEWGDPAVRPLMCDWRESDPKADSHYTLMGGLVCGAGQDFQRGGCRVGRLGVAEG